MKSKLTFLAMIVAVLFVMVSVNDAFASRTRMQSLTIQDDAAPYILADSQGVTWVNPAHAGLLPGLVAISWATATANIAIFNGNGMFNIHLTPGLVMCITFEASTDSLRDYASYGMLSGGDVAAAGVTGTVMQTYLDNLTGASPVLSGTYTASGGFSPLMGTPYPLFANGSLTFVMNIGRMKLGVQASLVYTDSETINDNTGNHNTYYSYEPRIAAGIFMPLSATMFLDVSLWINIPIANATIKNNHVDTLVYEGLGYDIWALARFTMMASRKDMLHFWFKFRATDSSTTMEADDDAGGESHDFLRNRYQFIIGISDEIKFAPNAFVFVGFDLDTTLKYFDYSGEDALGDDTVGVEASETDVIANIRFGVEAPLIAGITGRFGLTHQMVAYHSETLEVDDMDDVKSSSNGDYGFADLPSGNVNMATTCGVGFAWRIGQFNLDFNLNKQIFTQGPNFISGASNDLCTDVTFAYVFPTAASAPAAANEEK